MPPEIVPLIVRFPLPLIVRASLPPPVERLFVMSDPKTRVLPEPFTVNVPLPLILLKAVTAPPSVSVLFVPLSVITRVPPAPMPSVALPVPKFRFLLPPNVKSALSVIPLFVASVTTPPLVLSIVPPAIVNVPVPIAEFVLELPDALMFKIPAFNVVPPE